MTATQVKVPMTQHKSRQTSITMVTLELLRMTRNLFLLLLLPLIVILTLLRFPYDTDKSLSASPQIQRTGEFYEAAYNTDKTQNRGLDYEEVAQAAAEFYGIEEHVSQFADVYGLHNKKILEVGSGRGYLQDIVGDYTGLDLSPSVAGHYHKPFVVGSATQMPFESDSFDAIWTVWVLEHISEPEKALMEMRRVLKPSGVLFLYVAWNCSPWAAEGFDVRPYGDFNWRGKLVKASLVVRQSGLYMAGGLYPARAIRWLQYGLGIGDDLHYRALNPNYQTYWQPDSDAAVSLDSFETYLWFKKEGDTCMNCTGAFHEWGVVRNPLILKINKN